MILDTPRGRLRPWTDADRDAFADLHADPEVMWDYGGPIDRAASDRKFDRYRATFNQHGFSRWAMETRDGQFLGYVGVQPIASDHPAAPPAGMGVEIGWRFRRAAWGQGYATEGARVALADALARHAFPEILAYTASENLRSQAVMCRLPLHRDPTRDFTKDGWTGLVWSTRAAAKVTGS